LPAVLLVIGVLIFPLLRILKLSLFDPYFSLEHYERLLTVSSYSKILLRTFRTAFSVTVFCIILGYPVSYLMADLAKTKRRAASFMLFPVVLPFFTSFLVRTFSWRVLLGRQGLINNTLMWLGIINEPLKLLYNSLGVHVGMVHVMLPFMILPIYSVMVGIDRNLILAARSLGASSLQAFIRVFLPLSIPGVISGGVLIFILSLGFFLTPALLGGPRDTMIAQSIALNIQDLLNWGFASAEAIVLLCCTLLTLGILNRFFSVNIFAGRLA
jgi:ABC-type spermidine/putrescine transport system permease subunit I